MKWLTLGGRLILFSQYYRELLCIGRTCIYCPATSIRGLILIISNFIWPGFSVVKKADLVRRKDITMNKEFGGWGILYIQKFNWAVGGNGNMTKYC